MSNTRRRSQSKLVSGLNGFALLAGATALLVTVWIVVPALTYEIWLVSVGASEWSLAFGMLGVVCIVCSLIVRAGDRARRAWRVSLAFGALAVALSLYPPGSALKVAREHGVSLSVRDYVAGFGGARHNDSGETRAGGFSTHTFATVDGITLRLDAYAPPGDVQRNGAGVIVIHGGSWNARARSDFPEWNLWLARQGYTVFDIDYRLAPQPNWRTATGDVKCAVGWIKQRAGEFGIDPDRLALLGRSAGGHLALLAAYTPNNQPLASSCPEVTEPDAFVQPSTSRTTGEEVRAVVAFYAPTDLLWAYDNPANPRVIDGPLTLRRFVGGDPHASDELNERFRLVSPVTHVNTRTPPTLLIHGGHDQLVRSENMEILGAKLNAAGVPHQKLFIPYAQHGFDYNFNGWGAQIVRPLLLDFLRESTKPR